jgi:hypothetical protein
LPDLGALAELEASCENPAHRIESALVSGYETAWRAGTPGRQVIRLPFVSPQKATRIQLGFEEESVERTQEYGLRCSPARDLPCRENVRQQWNFNRASATVEIEDHRVDLPSNAVLELIVGPGSESQTVFASMERMRIGRAGMQLLFVGGRHSPKSTGHEIAGRSMNGQVSSGGTQR